MHAARIDKSARLQRVLKLLRYKIPYRFTTLEIIKRAKVCAVNSIISELRANGYEIDCRCVGRGRFEYELKEER